MKQNRLADNLRRLRGEMSQDALAGKAEIDRCTVNRIERGHTTNPGRKTLSALADALGVTVNELLREPEAQSTSSKRGRGKGARR